MVKSSESGDWDVWDCRELPIDHHPNLEHEEDIEDGLPNFIAQNEGLVRVTICKSCHPMIPGHISVEPENIDQYFDIEDVDDLVEALPRGLTSNRFELLMRKAVGDPYNPVQGHAGETFKLSLAYQLDRDEWKPDEEEVKESIPEKTTTEAYREAYSERSESYQKGDHVKLILDKEIGPDNHLHGKTGEIIDVEFDDAASVTGDSEDNFMYKVKLDNREVPDIHFRRHDLKHLE